MKTTKIKYGSSELIVRYLFDKDIIDLAIDQGLNLAKEAKRVPFSTRFIAFVCYNAVTGWNYILDPNGAQIDFDHDLVLDIFEKYPEMFDRVIETSTRLSRFQDG